MHRSVLSLSQHAGWSQCDIAVEKFCASPRLRVVESEPVAQKIQKNTDCGVYTTPYLPSKVSAPRARAKAGRTRELAMTL